MHLLLNSFKYSYEKSQKVNSTYDLILMLLISKLVLSSLLCNTECVTKKTLVMEFLGVS